MSFRRRLFIRVQHSIIVAGFLAFGWSGTANASLIDDTVNLQLYYPSIDTFFFDVGNKTVSTAVEYNLEGQENVDVTGNQIVLTFLTSGSFFDTSFNGLKFTDLTHAFASASFVSSSVAGIDASDVSFSNGSIFLNEAGSTYAAGGTVVLNVSSVPLPASAPMFGVALLTLGAAGYGLRRGRAAAA